MFISDDNKSIIHLNAYLIGKIFDNIGLIVFAIVYTIIYAFE